MYNLIPYLAIFSVYHAKIMARFEKVYIVFIALGLSSIHLAMQ